MESLYQISSNEPGKYCDFFPYASLHSDKNKIHYFCEIKELSSNIETKSCPICQKLYLRDHPFVEPNQAGDPEMCSNCFERKYIINSKNYRECIRQEVLLELKDKS